MAVPRGYSSGLVPMWLLERRILGVGENRGLLLQGRCVSAVVRNHPSFAGSAQLVSTLRRPRVRVLVAQFSRPKVLFFGNRAIRLLENDQPSRPSLVDIVRSAMAGMKHRLLFVCDADAINFGCWLK